MEQATQGSQKRSASATSVARNREVSSAKAKAKAESADSMVSRRRDAATGGADAATG